MSFTIHQEAWVEQWQGAPDQALQDLQEEGEDHELRWCLTFEDKGYKGVAPLSPLY